MEYRFLKHIPSGHIYMYAEPWIGHADFEECANAAGDPLPDPEAVVNPAPQAARAKRKTMSLVETTDDAALSADASRGLAAQGM